VTSPSWHVGGKHSSSTPPAVEVAEPRTSAALHVQLYERVSQANKTSEERLVKVGIFL
jgi:hypothetical protein